jgi:chemotaxis protein CheD
MNTVPQKAGTEKKNARVVSIGAIVTSDDPDDVLVVFGLGSCVAICLYDPVKRVGTVLHALLPTAPNNKNSPQSNPAKFVDQGVPLLIDALGNPEVRRSRLHTYLCGGAQMLTIPGDDSLNIGARNVIAAEAALQAAGLKLRAQATGGNNGRTVKLHISSGQVTVKSLQQEIQLLGDNN